MHRPDHRVARDGRSCLPHWEVDPTMGTTAIADRRDPTAPRRPFRTTVDLAPDDDHDAWRADAMDLSINGMSVRTAILPDVGEQLAFHFALADGRPVEARGEVIWARDRGERPGAFGVRFVSLPSDTEAAIRENVSPVEAAPAVPVVSPVADDTKVKLYIQGMAAPLRAKIRDRKADAMILGSDLSFLRLGEKVEVDGAHSRSGGTIEAVDVEIDPVTGIPRLVLTVDLLSRPRPETVPPGVSAPSSVPEPGLSATVSAPAPDADGIEPPCAMDTPMDLVARRQAPPEAAHATRVLTDIDDADEARGDSPDDSSDDSDEGEDMDDMSPTPSWLRGAMTTARTYGVRAAAGTVPMLRGAATRVGALGRRVNGVIREKFQSRGAVRTPPSALPRNGLRPQHAMDSDVDGGVAPGLKTRRMVVYAAAGLTLAAGIVAVASTGGPRPTTPHPQVAVAPTEAVAPAPGAAVPTPPETVPAGLPSAVQPGGAQGTTVPVQPGEPRMLAAHGDLPPDLAAAQNSPSARADEQPILGLARPHTVRTAVNPSPGVAPRGAVDVVSSAHAPVLGNPAIRPGTVLRLRMDGPVEHLTGAGARGGAIVLDVPGRRSLDVAAPMVRLDPRLASAQVFNRTTGAELTLRFRQPAPPFVARAVGNSVEIILGATPGAAHTTIPHTTISHTPPAHTARLSLRHRR